MLGLSAPPDSSGDEDDCYDAPTQQRTIQRRPTVVDSTAIAATPLHTPVQPALSVSSSSPSGRPPPVPAISRATSAGMPLAMPSAAVALTVGGGGEGGSVLSAGTTSVNKTMWLNELDSDLFQRTSRGGASTSALTAQEDVAEEGAGGAHQQEQGAEEAEAKLEPLPPLPMERRVPTGSKGDVAACGRLPSMSVLVRDSKRGNSGGEEQANEEDEEEEDVEEHEKLKQPAGSGLNVAIDVDLGNFDRRDSFGTKKGGIRVATVALPRHMYMHSLGPAENLVDDLEIDSDVLLEEDSLHTPIAASFAESTASSRRMTPFLKKLPFDNVKIKNKKKP